MGNFLATLGTIGVPLFNHLVTIPFIYHPYRWGGVPWKAPGWFQLALVTLIANITLIMILATIGNIMSTKQSCNKQDIQLSAIHSFWKVAAFLLGSAILSIFSSFKGPLLVWLSWLPYASWIIHGIIVAIPVLLLGAVGTTVLIRRVCVKPPPVNVVTQVKVAPPVKMSKARARALARAQIIARAKAKRGKKRR
jgi:hypothetical protein